MNRGYTNNNEFESYNDSRLNTDYAGTGYADHVCRPVAVDAEGRKHPIIRYTPANNSEGYVMEAERVVGHVTRAPVIGIVMTDSRYGSPEMGDMLKEYGVEKRYTQLGSVYDRPEVEKSLTKIQTEVSQPNKPTGPLINSNWRARPFSTGQDGNGVTKNGDEKDFIKGTNQKKVYSIPTGDKQNEGYTHISQGTNPAITNNNHNFYGRPNEGTTMPSRPLSRPTNDINESVEFLTEGINKTIQSEVNRQTKPGKFATTHWRNGSNFSDQGPKLDSGDDDLEMLKEPKMYPRGNLGKYYQPETENMYGRANLLPPISQGPPFSVPPAPPKKVKEAITSEDLIKKYKGVKVPW